MLGALTAGVAATLLAAIALCIWVAVGSLFLNHTGRPGSPDSRDSAEANDPVALPIAILIGSAITGAVFSVFTWLGVVTPAVIGVSALGTAVAFTRWRRVVSLTSDTLESYRWAMPGRAIIWAGGPAAALLWINAIAPPRDADSMRYHLAHIRQIIRDGGWRPIADYHYALPFGWTLNYLPFELLHLPQAAQIVNAYLLVVLVGAMIGLLRAKHVSALWIAIAVLLLLHPFIVRTFTGASADGYAIFVVFIVAALLLRADNPGPIDAAALGFAAWIGAQSRYQLLAVGLAAMVAILLQFPTAYRSRIRALALGAAGAALLASPFYLVNTATFGNPVWPIGVGLDGPSSSYADLVAGAYNNMLNGSLSAAMVFWGVRRLVTTLAFAPLPIVILGALAASLLRRRAELNRLVLFSTTFLLLWVVAQPRLYPRFILLLLPVAVMVVCLRFGLASADTRRTNRWWDGLAAPIAIAAMTVISAFASTDQIRYAATGDLESYHRFTWFYPVYAWVNRSLPRDARILVIVYSGHSYYLDRSYRRADPWLSGVVDWRRVTTAAALDSLLVREQYDYVIYQNSGWAQFPGGREMALALRQATFSGGLVPVRYFQAPLYTSRLRRRFDIANVYVLARAGAAAPFLSR